MNCRYSHECFLCPFQKSIRCCTEVQINMECLNCLSFPDENNIFFLLKCGHSFCQRCLITQQQNGKNLNCFSCNTKIPEDPILDSLAKYSLVYPMMANNSTHQQCAICEDSHSATKFCLDCNEPFCDDVAIVHRRHRLFKNHVIVTIEELNRYQNAHEHLSFLGKKSCNQHNKPFEFLDLETKTRNHLLCSDCLTGQHTSPTGLGDCASSLLHQKLEHIQELGSQGTDHLAGLREEEEVFSTRLEEMERSRDQALSEIRRVFGSLHEALQTRQDELEREVEELAKSARFQLSEERERSRVWQGQLNLLGKCVEEINVNSLPSPDTQEISTSLSSSEFSSELPSQFSPKKRPLSPPSTLSAPEFLSEKALMVDACLLEDALRSSLSSSRASSSLTDVQSRVRVSKIRDQIEFSFHFLSQFPREILKPPQLPQSFSSSSSSTSTSTSTSSSSPSQSLEEERALLYRISTFMCSVSSTSSCPFQSDWSKNKVQSVLTFYSEGTGANQLSSPFGMTYSPSSNIFYLCDNGNSRIQVFQNNAVAEKEDRFEIEFIPPTTGNVGPSLDLRFNSPPSAPRPTSICYHDGQLFIADSSNHRVQVWRAEDGSFLRMIGTGSAGNAVGQFNSPWGCTVYQNHVFVSDLKNHRIQKFSLSDWSVVKVIGSQGSNIGQLGNPRELSAVNNKLYVADHNNHRISVFDTESGAALSVIGPSLPRDENLSFPTGILFSHNLLFVSSQYRISVFDSDHNYLYSFGSSVSGEGQLYIPTGMVMVHQKLFVCDYGNGKVNVFEQKLDEIL